MLAFQNSWLVSYHIKLVTHRVPLQWIPLYRFSPQKATRGLWHSHLWISLFLNTTSRMPGSEEIYQNMPSKASKVKIPQEQWQPDHGKHHRNDQHSTSKHLFLSVLVFLYMLKMAIKEFVFCRFSMSLLVVIDLIMLGCDRQINEAIETEPINC